MKISNLPLIKPLWRNLRERRIVRNHQAVADFWDPVIKEYFEGKLLKYTFNKLKNLEHDRIIWQYWGQGLDQGDIPEIVQYCFESVDRFKGDFEVIRLSDDTINDYVELPSFVKDKRLNPAFGRTFFSDILRLLLLRVYGGVWLDATVMLTDYLPKAYSDLDYFVYQRDMSEPFKQQWQDNYAFYWGWRPEFRVRMLTSIMFGKPQSELIVALLDLMLYYWKTQRTISEYFFFQILYNELINGYLRNIRCPIVNDTAPHLLHAKFNGDFEFISTEQAVKYCTIHKMTYFDKDAMIRFRDFLSTFKKN